MGEHIDLGPQLGRRFEVARLLGEGAVGAVYLAQDRELGRAVALKVLQGDDWDGEALGRFKEEAAVLSRLAHPRIVGLLGYGGSGGEVPWLAMEYLEGGTLAERVEREGAQPVDRALRWGSQLCEALAFAHEQGVLHRDLKSQNVLLDAAGDVRVSDFGLAKREGRRTKLTATGVILGTPSGMAPEQVLGQPATEASDVYAAGVVLFQLVTGVLPFEGDDVGAVLRARLEGDVPDPRTARPGLPREVSAVIRRALAKAPPSRTPSFRALRAELEGCLGALAAPGAAGAPGSLETSGVRPRSLLEGRRTLAGSAVAPRAFPRPLAAEPTARRAGTRAALTVAAVLAAVGLALALGRRGGAGHGPEDLRVEASAHGAQVSWRAAQPGGRFEVLLRKEGKVVHRRPVAEGGPSHRVGLQGLASGSSYEVEVALVGGPSAARSFTTSEVVKLADVRSAAARGQLWLDYGASGAEVLSLALGDGGGAEATVEGTAPAKGPFVAALPPRFADGRPVRWELRDGARVLAEGLTPGAPASARPPADPPGVPRSAVLRSGGRGCATGPVWSGSHVVYGDAQGILYCWEARERLQLAWAFRPPGQRPRGSSCSLGGLVALDDGGVFFTVAQNRQGVPAPMAGWRLDPAERARTWRERVGDRPLTELPRFVDAAGDPWNQPLGAAEWRCDPEILQWCAPNNSGVRVGDLVFVQVHQAQLRGGARLGWACFDLRTHSARWLRTLEPREAFLAPLHAADAGEGGPWRRARPSGETFRWSPSGGARVLRGHLLMLVEVAVPSSPGRWERVQWGLATMPAGTGTPTGEPRFVCRFPGAGTGVPMGLDEEEGVAWLTGPRHLYRWPVGGQGPPDVFTLAPAMADDAAWLSGPVTRLGGRLHVGRLRTARISAFPQLDGVGQFCPVQWCIVAGPDAVFAPGAPAIGEDMSEAPPQVERACAVGGRLAWFFPHAMAVLEPASRRAGFLTLSSVELLSGASVSPEGTAAVVVANGTLVVAPLELVLACQQRRITHGEAVPMGVVGSGP